MIDTILLILQINHIEWNDNYIGHLKHMRAVSNSNETLNDDSEFELDKFSRSSQSIYFAALRHLRKLPKNGQYFYKICHHLNPVLKSNIRKTFFSSVDPCVWNRNRKKAKKCNKIQQ